MLEITHFTPQHTISDAPRKKLTALLKAEEGAIWVDITGPDDDEAKIMQDTFGFHPLAIEDTRNQTQRPKAEEFADHLFIILNPVGDMQNKDALFRELDVFVGKNYLVTVHPADEPVIAEARRRIEPLRTHLSISSSVLLYTLVDTVIDGYFPVLDQIDDEIDSLGLRILDQPDRAIITRLFQLKRATGEMWRVFWPQRDALNVLVNHKLVFIDQNSQYYLRDISDHLLYIIDVAHIHRDTLNDLINLHVSAVSNQLNRVVNRLTVFAIFIGVLTVVGGFYGMNFAHTWPPFAATWGVPVVMVIMAACTAVISWALRRKGWF